MKRMLTRTFVALAIAVIAGCGGSDDGLVFRPDGTFTIVQFTDTHLNEADGRDDPTYDLMRLVIAEDTPDLIMLTGDIGRIYPPDSTSEYAEIAKQTWPRTIAFLDSTGIPWAFVHGNHDAELATYSLLDSVILASENTLYDPGPADINGSGNYVLPVRRDDGSIGAALWCFDSGSGSNEPSGYGWIHLNQIEWFEHHATELSAEYGDGALSLAFFHIPLQQYHVAWETNECLGSKYEKVCMQGRDEGIFDAFKRHGVVGTFCGHDHVNDYACSFEGVTLAYGRGTGYRAYGREGFLRGARVIQLIDEGRAWQTYIRLADGTEADQPIHSPEAVPAE